MENETKIKLKPIYKILIILAILIISLYVWMRFIEPSLLIVEDYTLTNPKIPKSFEGFTIVQFSDIHFGRTTNEKQLNQVVKKINECKPDLVLFSGDLFDPYINLSENNINYLKDTLKSINASIKKYAVLGDYDFDQKELFNEILTTAGFEILNGQNQAIYYKDNTPIYINGIPSITKQETDLKDAFKKETDSVQLFLSHEPAIINKINQNADFIFAGHTLGGLIRLPFFKGLKKGPNFSDYDDKKNIINNTTLFISRGIGTQDISLRFLNLPSISCFRIKTS